MDINQGYSILRTALLENGRGFALGENLKAPSRYVTWACYDDEHGQRQYEWGHYGDDFATMEQDFSRRLVEYQMQFNVRVVQVEAPGLYKYYSTQRPVDIGTFPKPTRNAPDEIVNYDQRVPVEGGTFLAWGHLTYTRPLTDKQVSDYELRPAPDVAELCRNSGRPHSISQQILDAQVVGKWEDAHRTPATVRLTQYNFDLGRYVPVSSVTPQEMAECVKEIRQMQAQKVHKESGEKLPPISQQLREAQAQAEAGRDTAATKKDTPDRDDR